MVSTSVESPVLQLIHDEHERLETLISEVEWVLIKPSDTHLGIIQELMQELALLLKEHFAHEEEDGYFADLVELQPGIATRVDRLRHEHRELLATVQHMNRQLQHADSTALWFAMIGSEFAEFVRRCTTHQHEENRIVQEGYLTEIGAGD